MGYMDFTDPVLEKIFKRFKWTRNNTLELFDAAERENMLDYKLADDKKTRYTFQPVIFQFQCILTTTDAYFRRLSGDKNQQFGILVKNGKVFTKKDLKASEIKPLLKAQLTKLQELLKQFTKNKTETYINDIITISDHEYLHQGQLILLFRKANVELPKRIKTAWAL